LFSHNCDYSGRRRKRSQKKEMFLAHNWQFRRKPIVKHLLLSIFIEKSDIARVDKVEERGIWKSNKQDRIAVGIWCTRKYALFEFTTEQGNNMKSNTALKGLVFAEKPNRPSTAPILSKRSKLLERLNEQREMVSCVRLQTNGTEVAII